MDKKNTTIGVVLLLAAFATIYLSQKFAPPPTTVDPAAGKSVPGAAPTLPEASQATPAQSPATTSTAAAPASAPATAFAAVSRDSAGATVTTLGNDFIEAHFTDSGGALRDVGLKKYPKALNSRDPFVFNDLHADPLLAFVDLQGLDRNTKFERVSQTADTVVYRAVYDGRIEVTRTYQLSPSAAGKSDPYQVRHETTFRNLTDKATPGMAVKLSVGTAAPVNLDDPADQLASGFSTGKDREFIHRAALEASGGFLGIGAHGAKPAMISSGP